MTVTQILSCIIAPVLMPLFTRREHWKVKVYFGVLCALCTPLAGIPLFLFLRKF